MKLVTLPTFSATLPVSQQTVEFRPFIMKEEKILLMAAESDDPQDIVNAVSAAVNACTEGAVSCDTHSMVDVQYLFLNIRGKSVSEEMEFNLVCGNCQDTTPGRLNIEDVQVRRDPDHTKVISLTEHLIVEMRYPMLKHLGILSKENASFDDIYDVVADCIERISTEDEVYERDNTSLAEFREFIDNLTSEQFSLLKDFFTTMPMISHRITYDCKKCGTQNMVSLDDISNFFV